MGNDQSTAVSRREAMAASLLAAGGVLLGGSGLALAQQQAKPIRIAHLTDMHVQPERRAGEGYAAALQSLAKLDPPPDFLVTGGDSVLTPIIPEQGIELDGQGPLVRDVIVDWMRANAGRMNEEQFNSEADPRWNLPQPAPLRCELSAQ